MEATYYTINEGSAAMAQSLNSFSDYAEGSATAEYRAQVDRVYKIVDEIVDRKPALLERAAGMAERYSRKLAEYYNAYYRNEASCPSILVSGGSNFPIRKKERQNSRRDALRRDWEYLDEYAQKIARLLTMEQPILSSDKNAVELLEEKLQSLMDAQAKMKAVNAYYRKNKSLDGCADLTDDMRKGIEDNWNRGWYVGIPFPPYTLSNNNANIKRIRGRLDRLKKEQERGPRETTVVLADGAATADDTGGAESSGITIRENTEEMRLQLFFEGKPEPEVRDILKSQAFKWSPRNGCWQRQLTDNARYAAQRAVEQIRALQEGQKEG